MVGRPSSFTQAIADEICEHLVAGESLRKICKKPGFPNVSTVCRWLGDEANEAFRNQYARARELQADTLADEITYIADTPKLGVTIITKAVRIGDAEGIETRTKRGDMLGHRRLQIDARRWYAAKLNPKKYGDRVELGGELALKHISSEPLTEDAWAEKHGAATR